MAELIYSPSSSEVSRSQMTAFARFCAGRTDRPLATWADLHHWSITDDLAFWRLLLEWLQLRVTGSVEPVREGSAVEEALFFPSLSLSYVENLLGSVPARPEGQPVLIGLDEADGETVLTRGQLVGRVLRTAGALRAAGLQPGDAVVAVVRNTPDTVVACLATLALGATWTSAATDLGPDVLARRFEQLRPKVLFHHTAHRGGGEVRSIAGRIAELSALLPTLSAVIDVGSSRFAEMGSGPLDPSLATLESLPKFPFNHPLFVLFSSGTTGAPKGIIHGAGGTLLQNLKEYRLHADLGPADRIYVQTTCGWMMWNKALAALGCGSTLVTYDGAVAHPEPRSQWDLVSRHRVTVFGTNPGYLQLSRDGGVVPRSQMDLSALRLVMSTGTILTPALFTWVRDAVKPLPVHSTSGGTDIMGAWLLGNPNLPVRAGDLQCIGLGLDVAAVPLPGLSAQPLPEDVVARGELVCRNPFPSRPLGLVGDPDRRRFHEAWFSQHPAWWTHGDLIELTRDGGGRILGRSDGILNVRGIRIGPAEIYEALARLPAVREAMAVEQFTPGLPGESRLVLLVVPSPGQVLDHELATLIRHTLRDRCSPAHVPAVIAAVDDLPRTLNNKPSERAATDAVNGRVVSNRDALRNPECLAAIEHHPALQAAASTRLPGGDDRSVSRMTGIWSEVLGTPVEPDDDFFEIGGDSLRGLYLLNAVERELGVRLPMSSLLVTARTPREMERQLEARQAGDPRAMLVPLHPAETGVPIFWFPGGGGMSVLAFRPIAAAMGGGPILGLEARLDGPPAPDLPAMVRDYVDAIVAFSPEGPYRLFGFSSGAFVAFEAAHQLRARGAEVETLVLFDASIPVRLGRWRMARSLAQRAGYHARRIRSLPPGEVVAHLKGTFEVLRKRLRMALFPSRALTWHDDAGDALDPTSAFDLRDQHNRFLVDAYRKGPLRPYPGRIHLILAGRTSMSALSPDLDPRLAWQCLAEGGVTVDRVSGSHLSMLTGAGVPELASTLREILRESEVACQAHS